MEKIVSSMCPIFNTEKQITVEYRRIGGDGIKGNTVGSYVITKEYHCDRECNVRPCPVYKQAPRTF